MLRHGSLADGVALHFATAMTSGLLATVVSSPFDVVKSRVMGQPLSADGKGTLYKGMVDCFGQCIAREGPTALWKGFIPAWARVGPRVVIAFVVMEQLRMRFG